MRCNRCTLNAMSAAAIEGDQRLTLIKDSGELGGVNAYLHPDGVDVNALPDHEREQYWSAWFMAIPIRCAC